MQVPAATAAQRRRPSPSPTPLADARRRRAAQGGAARATSASRARTTTRCSAYAATRSAARRRRRLRRRSRAQFRLERFADVDLGPDYARIEEIARAPARRRSRRCRRASGAQPTTPRSTRAGASRRKSPLDADLLAQQRGRRSSTAGDADARDASCLERAVAAAPDQADYHALLGWAIFHDDRAPNAAAAPAAGEPPRAPRFEIDRRPHRRARLRRPHRRRRRRRRARDRSPDARARRRPDARRGADRARGRLLARAASSSGSSGNTASCIHRLGDGTRSRARAASCGGGWPSSTARASTTTSRRASPTRSRPSWRPTIRGRARRWRGCYAESPQSWREAAQALRESWRLSPDDPEPGRALFRLHLDGERWDAAYAVAAALAMRGAARARRRSIFYAATARASWCARSAPLDGGDHHRRARAPPRRRSRSVGAVRAHVRRLAAAGRLATLGVRPDDQLDATLLPAPFGRVLAYVARAARRRRAAGLSPRRLRRRRPRRRGATADSARRSAGAGAQRPHGARLPPRARADLPPARACRRRRAAGSRQLKQTVLATMTLACSRRCASTIPTARSRSLRAALATAAPHLARELGAGLRAHPGGRRRDAQPRPLRPRPWRAPPIASACSCVTTCRRPCGSSWHPRRPARRTTSSTLRSSDEYLAARDALGLSICV